MGSDKDDNESLLSNLIDQGTDISEPGIGPRENVQSRWSDLLLWKVHRIQYRKVTQCIN